MAKRSKVAARRAFLERYRAQIPRLERAKDQAITFTRSVVSNLDVEILGVDGRVKSLTSVREKLWRKRYFRPWHEISDKIGLRVMTYYAADVDAVVESLRAAFELDPHRSVDRRLHLSLYEFGYHSVHLIVRLTRASATRTELCDLRNLWFEIQVRSILDQAWSEIEHEVVYKSGIDLPEKTQRRFAALAGALEILEGEFLSLRREARTLINVYRNDLSRGNGLHAKLDVPRIIAALELVRPTAPQLIAQEGQRQFAPASTVKSCVFALSLLGIKTPRQMLKELRSPGFKKAVRTYAAQTQLAEANVSQLALCALLIGRRKLQLLEEWLPDLLADANLMSALGLSRGA